MLNDYVSFRSMYIEEALHETDSLFFFIGGNSGIGTWKYTKAILIYMNFYTWTYLKLKLNHYKQLIRANQEQKGSYRVPAARLSIKKIFRFYAVN